MWQEYPTEEIPDTETISYGGAEIICRLLLGDMPIYPLILRAFPYGMSLQRYRDIRPMPDSPAVDLLPAMLPDHPLDVWETFIQQAPPCCLNRNINRSRTRNRTAAQLHNLRQCCLPFHDKSLPSAFYSIIQQKAPKERYHQGPKMAERIDILPGDCRSARA